VPRSSATSSPSRSTTLRRRSRRRISSREPLRLAHRTATCLLFIEATPREGMRRRSNAAALRCAKGSLRCSAS
jgi:hypothetical protein